MDVNALSPRERLAAAYAIATFLRALHGLEPSPELASVLPREDERAVAEEYLVRAEREIVPKLQLSEATALRKQFEMHLGTPSNFSFEPVVLHADLGRDHLLVEDGSVVAALDFGDVNWGDPDYDFMYLFVDFGWAFVEEVARRYAHPDLERLGRKLPYFEVTDQIGTILDGPGRALEGQGEAAWRRLRRLLASGVADGQAIPLDR